MFVFSRRKDSEFDCNGNTDTLYFACKLAYVINQRTRVYCSYNCPCLEKVLCEIDILFWLTSESEICDVLVH